MFYVFMIIAHACYIRDMNVCGSNVCGPLHIGQVGRVAHLSTKEGLHMGVGLQSYLHRPILKNVIFMTWVKDPCGSPKEEQVGRMEQPAYVGKGPHMGLGIRSYIP